MKREVTDLHDVQVEMDMEDAELMQMFPSSRKTVINDMLLVRDKNGAYLVRKSDVARGWKVFRGIVMAVAVAFGGLMLVASVMSAVLGVGHPWLYLFAFEVTLWPLLAKIPSAVKGGGI